MSARPALLRLPACGETEGGAVGGGAGRGPAQSTQAVSASPRKLPGESADPFALIGGRMTATFL
jgi:hypothetical protein